MELEGYIVLNEHNTVFAQRGPLYVIGLSYSPHESSIPRYLDRLRIFCRAH